MHTAMIEDWLHGYGVIEHRAETVARIEALFDQRAQRQGFDRAHAYALLAAADRLASQGMWLVAHMTYARRVFGDGRGLGADDFKEKPEGHTGGALNMVIGYVGYLLANALTGHTRSWIMEQGHCVAAIDAVNALVGNTSPAHAARYPRNDSGLTRLVCDFYRYQVGPDGAPRSPLGSHVNAHTAGGVMEGGYLGFAGLQYVHMPLPGQRLVAFLSDGAFEEQRGPDWAPRWWRAEDCGLVAPILIANGRRIDQRTTLSQSGGTEWLKEHLRLNHFEPIVIDGRDPAAFAWAIVTQEGRLERCAERVAEGKMAYPVRLPYIIAETEKGFGFPGAGGNRAHNLPLPGNPRADEHSRALFNAGAAALFVTPMALEGAVRLLNNHAGQGRPRERRHALADIRVEPPAQPALHWKTRNDGALYSPMVAIDTAFVELIEANPRLRVRVGNPDELRSNRLNATLDFLKHRVTAPEPGIAESVHGAIITALNEEAVACAALANKQGLNLIATYEAFAVKMLGSVRQEIIFSRHCRENGRAPGWRSIPLIATSHTWENGKNEQSHQDPTLAEALLNEMSDVAPVLFPIDWNSAMSCLLGVYATCGAVATLVVPKNERPLRVSATQARALVENGILCVAGDEAAALQLIAVGAYQLDQALRAAQRLAGLGVDASVWALFEPGKFRQPRDPLEHRYVEGAARRLPAAEFRVLFCHTRPEPLLGVLRPLDLGPGRTRALGYLNRGGTFDIFGMLFANRCTWAHGLDAVAQLMNRPARDWLSADEAAAVNGVGDPDSLR